MIKHNLLAKFWSVIGITVLLFLSGVSKAQVCTGCTTVITANTSANITIGPSDIVCINPGVNVSGNITLNGGTLCNSGSVSNLTLVQGIFKNYGSFSMPSGNLNISNAKNLRIECFSNSGFDVANAVSVDALTANDSVVINVYGGSKFYIGKSFSVTKGWLKITNAIPDPLTKARSSAFNIGGQLNVSNSALKILNLPNGMFNVNKSINFDGKYNKLVNNYGVFNCNNSFNISGNGQNTYTVTINNYGSFNVTKNLSSSYNNGTVTINNYDYAVKPQPTFVIKGALTFSKDNNIFNNYRSLEVGTDITLEKGALVNYGIITARDIEVKAANFTNNNQVYASRDFIISNVNAVVNNNSYLDVSREFNNVGTYNGGLSSYLRTTNYYNLNNGTINGPSGISSDDQYAKILIAGQSENTGYINGKVLIHDQTLVGTANNNGYGFDQVNNASRISSNTAFAAKSVGPGPIITLCSLLQSIYSVAANASPASVCPGGSVNLTSQFYQKVTFTLYIWPSGSITITLNLPLSIPATSYTWTPGSLVGQNQTVSPSTSTTYTVKVNYLSCVFTKTVSVTVQPAFTTSISSNNSPVCFPSVPPLVLNSVLTPVPAGPSYQWYFNGVAVGTGGTSPSINPSSTGNYYLKVTSSAGCTSTSNTITVNQTPTVNITSSTPVLCNSLSTALLTANIQSGSGTISNYQWQYNSSNVGTNSSSYTANAGGNYGVTVTNNFGCVSTANLIINSSVGLAADAGFDQFFVSGNVTIGGSPTAAGGVAPYSYNWTPNFGCVTAGCNTTSNPQVAPNVSTLYTLQVTDANGCTVIDQVMVTNLTSNISYAVPKKNIDGGYHVPVSNKVYFKFEEEYRTSTLTFKIFDYNNTTLNTPPVSVICTNLIGAPKNLGDNRYFIDLSTCTGVVPAKFYLLELTNDKNEKFYLKFQM